MKRNYCTLASFVLALSLTACGGGGGNSGGGGSTPTTPTTPTQPTAVNGTLKLSMTDGPSCGYEKVNVSIEKLRVHQSATATDSEPGWVELAISPALRVDLLSLQNGTLKDLGQLQLPIGHYSQLRLALAANTTSNPMANSVVPVGGAEQALAMFSAPSNEVKVNADIGITANQQVDFVLDFDACQSLVAAGANQTLLKPAVKLMPASQAGVSGKVDLALANGNTRISLQKEGRIVKATTPDAEGNFKLSPVAAGTYHLVVTAPNRAAGILTGVVVNSGSVTVLGSAGQTFGLPSTLTAALSGAASTGVNLVDANVRVMQTLSNGAQVELASRGVNALTGAYSHTLPIGAPMVGIYSASSTSLPSFALDGAVVGRYSLEASSGTAVKTAGPLTLLDPGTSITTNFSFP